MTAKWNSRTWNLGDNYFPNIMGLSKEFKKSMDKLDNKGLIEKFASYLADKIDNFVKPTKEDFPKIITSGPGREYDANTRDKLRNGDTTYVIDWSTFVTPSTLPNETSIMGKMYAYSWTLDRLADVFNLNHKNSIKDTIVPLSIPLNGKDTMINVKIPKASKNAMYHSPHNGSFYNEDLNPYMIEKRDSIINSKK